MTQQLYSYGCPLKRNENIHPLKYLYKNIHSSSKLETAQVSWISRRMDKLVCPHNRKVLNSKKLLTTDNTKPGGLSFKKLYQREYILYDFTCEILKQVTPMMEKKPKLVFAFKAWGLTGRGLNHKWMHLSEATYCYIRELYVSLM